MTYSKAPEELLIHIKKGEREMKRLSIHQSIQTRITQQYNKIVMPIEK